jgi:flagellar motor component MotA
MDNITFAVWVSGRLEFSDEDRRACFDTARTLVEIAVGVRKHGLLIVEDTIQSTPDFFMKQGLQMAIDDYSLEPDLLKERLQNWIVFGNYRGAELLRCLIIIDGVVAIVRGENPRQMNTALASFFGKELWEEYNSKIKLTHNLETKKYELN